MDVFEVIFLKTVKNFKNSKNSNNFKPSSIPRTTKNFKN